MSATPVDGQITSLTVLTVLVGNEAFEVVSPGNANQGNSYQVLLPTLLAYFASQIAPVVPLVVVSALAVDFNSANTDTPIAIPALPTGYTRYRVENASISNASGSLTTATFGLFSAPSGAGVAIIYGAAVTVSSSADGSANNMQSVAGLSTTSFTQAGFSTLYFRVGSPEGSPATANVTLRLVPLP